MEINAVYEIIIAAAPAITSIIGIIVSLVAGIKRIKQANRDTLNEVRDTNAKIIENVAKVVEKNEALQRENEELKMHLRKISARLHHVHIIEDK